MDNNPNRLKAPQQLRKGEIRSSGCKIYIYMGGCSFSYQSHFRKSASTAITSSSFSSASASPTDHGLRWPDLLNHFRLVQLQHEQYRKSGKPKKKTMGVERERDTARLPLNGLHIRAPLDWIPDESGFSTEGPPERSIL